MIFSHFKGNFRRMLLTSAATFALLVVPVMAQTTPKVYPVKTVTSPVGNKVADFTWMEGDKQVSLSEIGKNKVVFLNFWATWCAPCRKEIPDIIELSKEFPNTEFVVIGVSMDRDQDAINTVSKFVRVKNLPYTVVVGNEALAEAYGGITAIPSTFILTSDGTVSEKISGMKSKAEFITAIQKAMKLNQSQNK
ncbi:MAG: TlpA family protein disulfide reductase [Bacteroidetes bacterium]|nr:TlpA family protein disulfide reductase [Bacteroidota bacterium]